jgi:poly-gamma-glutamate synthesis protein (capsule biosynthesis protein)
LNTLTATGISSTLEITHSCPPEAGAWFQKINADIWTIANNHVLDCGDVGLIDTKNIAKQNGAVTVGAGLNSKEAEEYLSLDCEGGIGIYSVTYKRGEFIRATNTTSGCVLFDEPKKIKRIIKEIKSKHRWCVLIAHGGDEFCNLPLPYIRKLYKKFLKFGADVVVGHHPHIVQNYEKVGGKMIFYSLGNFVFDTDYQRKQKYSEYGILLKLSFDNDKIGWNYIATKVNRQNQTIETTSPPTIFREISEKDYKRLWPLSAKKFCENFIVGKMFVIPKTKDYNAFKWFNFHRKKSFKSAIETYFGKFLYRFGAWKKGDEALKIYLEQK